MCIKYHRFLNGGAVGDRRGGGGGKFMDEIRVAKRDTPWLWTFMMSRPSTYEPNVPLHTS
jgi:hypothetical protein